MIAGTSTLRGCGLFAVEADDCLSHANDQTWAVHDAFRVRKLGQNYFVLRTPYTVQSPSEYEALGTLHLRQGGCSSPSHRGLHIPNNRFGLTGETSTIWIHGVNLNPFGIGVGRDPML